MLFLHVGIGHIILASRFVTGLFFYIQVQENSHAIEVYIFTFNRRLYDIMECFTRYLQIAHQIFRKLVKKHTKYLGNSLKKSVNIGSGNTSKKKSSPVEKNISEGQLKYLDAQIS